MFFFGPMFTFGWRNVEVDTCFLAQSGLKDVESTQRAMTSMFPFARINVLAICPFWGTGRVYVGGCLGPFPSF